MCKKLMAFLFSLFCFSLLFSVPVFAQDENISVVPDWIPQNFEQALEFENTYGKTHIADGVICCVQQRAVDYYQYETILSSPVDSESVRILSETSCYFEKTSPDDSYYSEELFYEPYFYYEITVYQPLADGIFSVSWLKNREGFEKPISQTDLSFQIENGIIQEIDLYAWLPDCMEEFDVFRQENGIISLHDNYVIYCDDVCYDGGYNIAVEQSGTTELREVCHYDIALSSQFMAAPGGMGHVVIVYEPVSAGNVKAVWLQQRPWESWGDVEKKAVICLEVDTDLSIQKIQENQFTEPVQNDITGDGISDILDLITLQKWLLGEATLINWRNADLNTDGVVNIYDFCLLKKALLESGKNVAYSVLEQNWTHNLSSRIQDMEEQVHFASSVGEFRNIIESYELCEVCECPYQNVENLIPEALNERFFEDYAVIVLYSAAGSGDRKIELNKISWQEQDLIVYTTTTELYPPTPDQAYCRTILVVDQDDLSDWTEDSEIIQQNRSIYRNILEY